MREEKITTDGVMTDCDF
uniref:Uncharacterized protein n=1 Tax=Anguilla anguilla TaxID=7936 RepID=A0A0E9VSV4_ANGAN